MPPPPHHWWSSGLVSGGRAVGHGGAEQWWGLRWSRWVDHQQSRYGLLGGLLAVAASSNCQWFRCGSLTAAG